MKNIHVGFLMSYDYELLKNSIPPVYSAADKIFIALDQNYRTWSGGKFKVDDRFFDWLTAFDVDNKITFYREDFYEQNKTAMENEVEERRKLALKMGIGNWLVQVDSDEYFLDFSKFAKDLQKYNHFLDDPKKTEVQIGVFTLNLYKYVEDGVLYVEEVRRQKLATNYPSYKTGRNTGKRVIYTRNLVIHECISRSEKEISLKLKNWGHSHQVNPEKFIEKWRAVNKDNFRNHKDFFYLEPEKWKNLDFVKGKNISEINQNMDYEKVLPSNFFLWKKNLGQKLKFLLKK